ncbi:hypothetical protein BDV10DRAFT_183079 [Aspergillus recurvatus]
MSNPRYYVSKFTEALPKANALPRDCGQAKPCTDFSTMCEYCWARFESGERRASHGVTTCKDLTTMCDFCWRAYETMGQGESAVKKDDNCLDLATMCDPCRKAFNAYKRHIPQGDLFANPGTYPVIAYKCFAKGEVEGSFSGDISRAISERLGRLFCVPVKVYVFTITAGGETSPAMASVMIEFPDRVELDRSRMRLIFDGLPGDGEGLRWAIGIPRKDERLSYFRLRWFKTMEEFGEEQELKVNWGNWVNWVK